MPLTPDAEAARQALPLFQEGNPFLAAVRRANATALRTLLSAAAAASVPEEIDILLRYQAARGVIPQELRAALQPELENCARRDKDAPMGHIVAFLGQIVRLHKSVEQRGR
ncbi:hypothetical protein L6R53_16735 [Myxococcota bacterium]|nr:hypothetical protein [Myxococcota bacterium]